MSESNAVQHFSDLDLPAALLRAVQDVGYETPTPIQSRTLPPLLEGRDLLGHAPTGTGKTAAFALPILARLDLNARGVQALILAPTRELAIQVAEAFSKYAKHMKNMRVLPIYGGQDYTGQIKQLNRGVNVVVGTPGRIMDHMRRGTLKLDHLKTLVLDEADEMLRMGFIDDVEWILEQTPENRQMALFSATMPPVIRRIASKHLSEPVEITIEGRLTTAATIRQRFWLVSGLHKLDALTRILEAETFDAMLVFVRTRTATVEVADKLSARGFSAAAMNGDMPQKQRENMVDKLKRGQIDILVATDVVARGLDVKRISHVINYDIPYDTEAYVHRIGRTGRAGRYGDAILFVTQRERRLLGSIEHATRQKIEPLQLPTVEMVNNKRIADFKQRISDTLAGGELAYLQRMIEEFSHEHNVPADRVAAALAKMCMGDQPLLLAGKDADSKARKDRQRDRTRSERDTERSAAPTESRTRESSSKDRAPRDDRKRETRAEHDPAPVDSRVKEIRASHNAIKPAGKARQASAADKTPAAINTGGNTAPKKRSDPDKSTTAQKTDASVASVTDNKIEATVIDTTVQPESRAAKRRAAEAAAVEMERFRVEVGQSHGVKPENLMGAIANEAGLDSQFIGQITINADHSLIELPAGMPKFLLKDLKRVWVCERKLDISRVSSGRDNSPPLNAPDKKPAPRKPKVTVATVGTEGEDLANEPGELKDKRERKKKERHRNKKNKGKRT